MQLLFRCTLLITANSQLLKCKPTCTYRFVQALQYSMSFFDAEKSGTLTANDISWRGNSALSDSLNGSSLVGGFYDGANGRHVACIYAASLQLLHVAIHELQLLVMSAEKLIACTCICLIQSHAMYDASSVGVCVC